MATDLNMVRPRRLHSGWVRLQLMRCPPSMTVQVENIALLSNAPDNGFVGVNMYCADDAGSYDAPTNMRATQIAHRCGKPLDVSLRSLICTCAWPPQGAAVPSC